MNIITGKTGSNHVMSDDDRALHAGTWGKESYVLNVGKKLEAYIESSNIIRLGDGDLMHNGIHARIRYGEYEDVVFESGTTGYKRKDIIVARYTKRAGIEKMEPVAIKGQPDTSDPVCPDYIEGNILEGAETSDMPLYEILLNGVNIESVKQLFKIQTGLDDVYRKNETYNKEEINNKTNELNKKAESLHKDVTTLEKKTDNLYTHGMLAGKIICTTNAVQANPFEAKAVSGTCTLPDGQNNFDCMVIPTNHYNCVVNYFRWSRNGNVVTIEAELLNCSNAAYSVNATFDVYYFTMLNRNDYEKG